MKIAIIGAGNVGRALGGSWSGADHHVVYGVPDPADAKYADLKPDLRRSAEAAVDAEVIVLATPWDATKDAIASLGAVAGKTIIDCTNPLGFAPGKGLFLKLGFDTSGGEQVAEWAKGAFVFKTLNQTGAENMAAAHRFTPRPVMFVAGDDTGRKAIVQRLVEDLGFDAVDAGPLSQARLLEPLAMLWIDQAMVRGRGRDFALTLIRRPETKA